MVLQIEEHHGLQLQVLGVLASIKGVVQKGRLLDLDHALLQNATVGDVAIQVSLLKTVPETHHHPETVGVGVVNVTLVLTLGAIQIAFLLAPKKDEANLACLRWQELLVN